ncbi:MAG: acyl-CoA thioesterase [Deltaproteobacteria bacterium]|nr:acyl-CoA thioesterase [Deltaproteobacteria bacterium]
MNDYLNEYPIIVEQPVDWGDMDANSHVNATIYFRYMENARIVFYERIGKYEYEARTGVSFVVASTSCTLRHPLVYPDRLLVGTRVENISGSRIFMKYRIVSTKHGLVAADGEAIIATHHYVENKNIPFPDELRHNIETLQGRL